MIRVFIHGFLIVVLCMDIQGYFLRVLYYLTLAVLALKMVHTDLDIYFCWRHLLCIMSVINSFFNLLNYLI